MPSSCGWIAPESLVLIHHYTFTQQGGQRALWLHKGNGFPASVQKISSSILNTLHASPTFFGVPDRIASKSLQHLSLGQPCRLLPPKESSSPLAVYHPNVIFRNGSSENREARARNALDLLPMP